MPWLHKIFLKLGVYDQYLVWNRATLNLHRKRLHRKRLHRNGENDATVGEDKAIPHPVSDSVRKADGVVKVWRKCGNAVEWVWSTCGTVVYLRFRPSGRVLIHIRHV